MKTKNIALIEICVLVILYVLSTIKYIVDGSEYIQIYTSHVYFHIIYITYTL